MLKKIARATLGPGHMDESRWLWRLLGRGPQGTLLEVGAHEGDEALVSFAQAGWRVFAFEPDEANRAVLSSRVAALPSVEVIPKAVADKPGMLTLFKSDESTGISSLAPFTDRHRPAGEVEVVTLTDFIQEREVARVDLLKMDVEGYEKFVLDGFPWTTHLPRAVLLEFEDRKTLPLGYSWRDLADRLSALGYDVTVSEWFSIERYGIDHQWRDLKAFPAQLDDSDAWGNLIATTGNDTARLRRIARTEAARLRASNATRPARRMLKRACRGGN